YAVRIRLLTERDAEDSERDDLLGVRQVRRRVDVLPVEELGRPDESLNDLRRPLEVAVEPEFEHVLLAGGGRRGAMEARTQCHGLEEVVVVEALEHRMFVEHLSDPFPVPAEPEGRAFPLEVAAIAGKLCREELDDGELHASLVHFLEHGGYSFDGGFLVEKDGGDLITAHGFVEKGEELRDHAEIDLVLLRPFQSPLSSATCREDFRDGQISLGDLVFAARDVQHDVAVEVRT